MRMSHENLFRPNDGKTATNSEGDADNRTDNQEVEQSSRNNVHLEQLIDNCTPVEEGPIWLPKRLNDSMPNAKGY